MAHFDMRRQEQFGNLKYIWQNFGKYIIGAVIIAFLSYMVNLCFSWHNSNQASKASVIYADLSDAVNMHNKDKALSLTYKLQNEYSGTEYTGLASLLVAKITWESKDLVTTAKLLDWVINNAKDNGLVSVARLRFADVLIEQKKFDEAMQQLQKKHDKSFDALYYIKRGDLYVAKNELDKARDAYKEAQQKSAQDPTMSQGIQLRLDVLGNN